MARAHHVLWWTNPAFSQVVEGAGARLLPMSAAAAIPCLDALDNMYPERRELAGASEGRWDIAHIFLEPASAQVAELQWLVTEYDIEVIVADTGVLGVALLRELGGPLWTSVGTTPLELPGRDTAPFGAGHPPATTRFGRLRNRVRHLFEDRVMLREAGALHNRIRPSWHSPRRRPRR